MSRGVSTAVDATVFLLVVSAATLTVATAPRPPPVDGDTADETAFVVATATAAVEYDAHTWTTDGNASRPDHARTAHGTLAGLLADAAFATATVDGQPLAPAGAGFERAVRTAVRERLPREGVQVFATWRPVPGSGVVGRTTVGPSPPPDADVAAATLAVSVPGGDPEFANRTFPGIAAATARAVVRARFPPDATGTALRAGLPDGSRTRFRYRHAAGVLGANLTTPLRRGDVTAANRRLAALLAGRFERALRRRYDDPRAAVRAVAVGRVRVTVRRWSP